MKKAKVLVQWFLMVVGTLITVWLSVSIATAEVDPWNAIVPMATLVPALIVLLRRDWHIVGWLLLLVAGTSAAQFAEVSTTNILSPPWLGWVYAVLNVGFWAAMAALVAVFPDGIGNQLGTPRVVDRVIVIGAASATFLSALSTEVSAAGWNGPFAPPRYDNPLGFGLFPGEVGEALGFLALGLFVVATATLVVRARRATGDSRQQHIWVLFPFAVLVVGVPIAIVITELRGEAGGEWFVAVLAYVAIPICFGVAMTRYRLYDIGKIISRTVTYTIVVVALGALYFGMVTLISAVLPTQNALGVAASTLAAAAVFNPVRKRIQRRVDRRFNRSAYQAEMISEEFAAELRRSLTAEELTQLWTQTVNDFLHPARSGVWIHADSQPSSDGGG
ncbi:MAG: hypothetical protein WBM90_04295 [Acidimicrobiia bacterium]